MLISSSKKYNSFVKNYLSINPGLKEYHYSLDTFKDGEWRLKFNDSVARESMIYVCGFVEERDFLDFYDFTSECYYRGINKITVLCPYIRNSTQEKTSLQGNASLLRNRINLLSATPMPEENIEFYFLDLHSDLAVNYFPKKIRAYNLDSFEVFKNYLMSKSEPIVLTGADQGQFKRVERWAQSLQMDYACAFKIRKPDGVTGQGCTRNLTGANVVLVDDIIKTGETILSAAKTLKAEGVKDIEILATHGAITIEAVTNLYNSGMIQRLTCTDSISTVNTIAESFPDFFKVIPSHSVFNEIIQSKC